MKRFTGTIDGVATDGEIEFREEPEHLSLVARGRWYEGEFIVDPKDFQGRQLGKVYRLKADGIVEIDVRLTDWWGVDSWGDWPKEIRMARPSVDPIRWKPMYVYRFISKGPPL